MKSAEPELVGWPPAFSAGRPRSRNRLEAMKSTEKDETKRPAEGQHNDAHDPCETTELQTYEQLRGASVSGIDFQGPPNVD